MTDIKRIKEKALQATTIAELRNTIYLLLEFLEERLEEEEDDFEPFPMTPAELKAQDQKIVEQVKRKADGDIGYRPDDLVFISLLDYHAAKKRLEEDKYDATGK